MTLLNLALLSCAFSLVTSSIPYCSYCAVQNLVAEPDYRAVKLTWKYLYAREPPGFRISFCEVSIWNSKLRCRQKYLPVSSAIQSRIIEKDDANLQHLDKLVRFDRNTYQASVFDLRMVTNYTFSVEADFSLTHDPAIGDSFHKFGIHANNPLNINEARAKQYNVTVETKGFSGKTMVCLSNATEVIVHTGPYFNGKISVENVPDDGCSVFGNHSSPLDTYTLTIHHGRCGSQIVDNNRIETMIIVHENKEILTHNSRRFLVVCNFPPETYTLKASVELPSHLLKRKKNNNNSVPRSGANGSPQRFRDRDGDSSSSSSSADAHGHRSSSSSSPPLSSSSLNRVRADSDPNHINVFDTVKVNNVHDSRILALHQEHKMLSNYEGTEASVLNTMMGCTFFVAILIGVLVVFIWYASSKVNSAEQQSNFSQIDTAIIAATKERKKPMEKKNAAHDFITRSPYSKSPVSPSSSPSSSSSSLSSMVFSNGESYA